MIRVSILAAILTTVFTAPAEAHDIPINTGIGLLANCTYQSDDPTEIEFHIGVCVGFIKGVTNSVALQRGGSNWCAPQNMNNRQLIDAVLIPLRSYQVRQLEAPSPPLITAAIDKSFKCK